MRQNLSPVLLLVLLVLLLLRLLLVLPLYLFSLLAPHSCDHLSILTCLRIGTSISCNHLIVLLQPPML